MSEKIIFSEFFMMPAVLQDRRLLEPNLEPVDVIIPIINTNPLFRRNLHNFYQRVPVNRLIIGDGGSTDGSIDVAKSFPRVTVIDQRKYKSLGKCIAELMDHVETDWFIYFHADVFLPEGWYETMSKFRSSYDWFECSQRNSVMCDYWSYDHRTMQAHRAFSGAQMGRRKALQAITPKIEDDYLQRQEDAIIASLIEEGGFKYGRVTDTHIHHQVMNKVGNKEPKLQTVSIHHEEDPAWIAKMADMQIRGFIKYMKPTRDAKLNVLSTLQAMTSMKLLDEKEFRSWVKNNYPIWYDVVDEYLLAFKTIQRRKRVKAYFMNFFIGLIKLKDMLRGLFLPKTPALKE